MRWRSGQTRSSFNRTLRSFGRFERHENDVIRAHRYLDGNLAADAATGCRQILGERLQMALVAGSPRTRVRGSP
jgi:hypothetical protein